jgi:DNA processing protein
LAEPIYDIEAFSDNYGVSPKNENIEKDDFFYFCQKSPTLDSAIEKFSDRVYEAELEGLIFIENGLIRLV